MPAYCYFILCKNEAFYTGWTKNIKKRFTQHLKGKGAYYTKVHTPLEVIYWESYGNDNIARKREVQLKKLTHNQKKMLFKGVLTSMTNQLYFERFDYFVKSPGRVNLLGEHVDYNGGSVLPVAIDRSVSLWANRREDQLFSISALDLGQSVVFSLDSINSKMDVQGNNLPDWALYPAGVVWIAHQQNLQMIGFDSAFKSNIPIGSGLSSSAAVEVAFAALSRELGMWEMDNTELALLTQEAEGSYVGVNCGIMDQFACANGVANSAIYLQTATLQWQSIPLPNDIAIVIANSKIKHSLANSAYNDRRSSCEEALSLLKKDLPQIQFLADVSPSQLEQYRLRLSDTTFKRAKHVIEECERVRSAIPTLQNGEVARFGELMKASHVSLQNDYEVSLSEIDTLVEIANRIPFCYGSRMTGAGFGGCTVSLVQLENVELFIKELTDEYKNHTGFDIDVYLCKASNGVTVQWRNRSANLTNSDLQSIKKA